jgi:hypothetical protein
VRVEAIVTSLVFDHALRVRLKAETQETKNDSPATPPVDIEPAGLITNGDTETPEVILVASEDNQPAPAAQAVPDAGVDTQSAHSKSATAVSVASTSATVVPSSPSSSIKGKDGKDGKAKKDDKKADKKSDNLIGKLI